MYILFAIIGYALLAFVLVLDKFILTKSVTNPALYTFYSTIFLLPLGGLYFFGIDTLVGVDWVWAMVSGFTFAIALWTMYGAVQQTEATHMNPFIAAITAVATFLLAIVVFHERLPLQATAGIFLLILSCLLLSFEITVDSRGISRGYWLGVLSGILFAISHLAAKHVYLFYSFVTGFVWTRAAIGMTGLAMLALPSVRRNMFHKSSGQSVRGRGAWIVILNKVIGIASAICVQLAIAQGSVTIVNALVGVEFMMIFCIIFVLTKLRPNWLNEYFTTSEIFVEIFAIVLIVIGSVFLIPTAL
jgi:drug/metabolite transporter (DMT)-like permease